MFILLIVHFDKIRDFLHSSRHRKELVRIFTRLKSLKLIYVKNLRRIHDKTQSAFLSDYLSDC